VTRDHQAKIFDRQWRSVGGSQQNGFDGYGGRLGSIDRGQETPYRPSPRAGHKRYRQTAAHSVNRCSRSDALANGSRRHGRRNCFDGFDYAGGVGF
jgi:hypothetical protein